MHLGMTGRFTVEGKGLVVRPGDFVMASEPDPKHAHVVFETEADDIITFHDPRRFGFMGLVETAAVDQHPWFAGMGPEPLSAAFNAGMLAAAFKGRKQGPKTLLLDQRIVAGLGNIYVCEALHRARISPFKPAAKIPKAKIAALVPAIKDVLLEAIAAGGSTLKDFAGSDGALGYFQHRFVAYGREHEPCLREGCRGVIARQVQAGRSTFYCPVCQT